MSGIIDFRTPAAGFDQPIEMWLACHERLLRMTALLIRLRDHVAGGGALESAQVTATSILRYFDEAAPRHHEDEELDLFPRLMKHVKGAERDKIVETVDVLRAEHIELDRLWKVVRPILTELAEAVKVSLSEDAVLHFVNAYQQHVERENEMLSPAFRRAFSDAELEAIGCAMAGRRGVHWDELRTPK